MAEMFWGSVDFPWRKISVPMYRTTGAGGSSRGCRRARSLASRESMTQAHPPRASEAAKAGDCRDVGSQVEPCWIFLSGTETSNTP